MNWLAGLPPGREAEACEGKSRHGSSPFLCKIYDIDKSMARERVPGILNLFDIHGKTGEDLYQLLNDVRNVQNEDFWMRKGKEGDQEEEIDCQR